QCHCRRGFGLALKPEGRPKREVALFGGGRIARLPFFFANESAFLTFSDLTVAQAIARTSPARDLLPCASS
ncbi:hypothetical protein, partial [Streptococcus pneumoniae]|uniref:hypothetical protein n=1 Tax=Streptococcus pneumoniae TaxID=1313 RepID=UPI001953E3D3